MHSNSTITNHNAHHIYFMQCPYPMWIFDSGSLKFLEVNQAAITQYGYTKEQFLSMSILDIRPAEDKDSIIGIVNQSKKTKKPYQYNHRHIKNNGDLIQVNIASNFIEFEERAARIVIVFDITEVLKVKERLDLSDRRLKSLLQQSTELIAIINSDFNFTFIGASSLSILGISPETLIGENVLEFVHDDDKNRIVKEITAIQQIKFYTISPFRFKTIHGDWRWLEVKITNSLYDKAISGVVCNAIDITDRMLEVNRRMQEEKWSKILESVVINTLDGVMITDADYENGTSIIYVNRALLDLSGYSRSELIGMSPTIFHAKNLDQPGLKILGQALKEEISCRVELVNYTKSGMEYHICITISPVYDDDGVVTHWISIQQDITRYKNEILELKAELKRLDKQNSSKYDLN